jgi:hypothetical protein
MTTPGTAPTEGTEPDAESSVADEHTLPTTLSAEKSGCLKGYLSMCMGHAMGTPTTAVTVIAAKSDR